MTEETSRKPDYYKDIKRYGKFGEDIFIEKISNSRFQIIDVTKNEFYQKQDVDFILVPENGEIVLVEVKTDTRAWETKNLPYEVISHGHYGWSITTKATHVFFVLAKEDKETKELEYVGWLIVDMKKWHEYCQNPKTEKIANFIKNEQISDILCNITHLIEEGVITKKSKTIT